MAKIQAKKANKTPKTLVSAEQLQRLKKWNTWLAVLLAGQALAIGIIGTARTFPVTTQYLAVDTLASDATGGQTLAAATRHLFDIRLAWVVAAFLLLFALAHFLMATFGRRHFERRLGQGMNDIRWAAFGVGGGVLLIAIGLLSGMYQLTTLLALLAFMLVGCLAVLAAGEITRREAGKSSLLSHLVCAIGTAGIAAPLVMIALAVGGALLYDGHIPGFVYGIYAVTALFFLALGLLTHFRAVRRGKWADTFATERAYMFLGFLGVSVVAWQIFAGALQP